MANSRSFSMVFLAMAAILLLLLLAGEADAGRAVRGPAKKSGKPRRPSNPPSGDLCKKADYPALCKAVTSGQRSAFPATQATVKRLASETAAARSAAAKLKKKFPEIISVCLENYDDALSSLKAGLADMAKKDKGGFNSNLSAALTDYVTCDDTFDEMGETSPLANTNSRLRHIASTGLFLATLWR